jgi:hypothetical protein
MYSPVASLSERHESFDDVAPIRCVGAVKMGDRLDGRCARGDRLDPSAEVRITR